MRFQKKMSPEIADTYRIYCDSHAKKTLKNRVEKYYEELSYAHKTMLIMIMVGALGGKYSVAMGRANVVLKKIMNIYNTFKPIIEESVDYSDIDFNDEDFTWL